MSQKNISIEDLAANERFQQYCFNPTDKEKQYWEEWMNKNEVSEASFSQAQYLVKQLALSLSEEEIQEELIKLRTNISSKALPKRASIRPKRLLQLAATILFLLSLSALWVIFSSKPEQLLSYQTTFSQIENISLEEGSHVVLNANSSLQVNTHLSNASKREAWLEGEAFFDIAHLKGKPFIVHTPEGDIRVLGTSFNISQRQSNIEVTLLEGSVRIQFPSNREIDLHPGEQAIMEHGVLEVNQIDTLAIAAWRNNQMHFKNVSIERIISQVENDFGWKIELENKALLERRINAQIPENNPALLFKALSAIYDLTFEKIGENTYVIK